MNTNIHKAREIFIEAVGKVPPEEWDAFLVARCGDDAELHRHVKHLLQAHLEAGSFLEQPVVERPTASEVPEEPAEGPGTWIGPYKLLQKLGEGGMGTVFLAEQQEPVQRQVALKLLRAGLAGAHVIGRFEQERQALALMDHPNIAKVFDAGTTDTGRPYFVMELVKGLPITQFCDQEQMTPRQRLELLVPVCQAVQHAHQKGIIHRDLKPSNVLIALYDGRPVPKVIDFGVAKATGPKLTERTLFTEVGQMVGTLEYMAPEQAELNNLDIDTRADIYALGVILYELLTGSPPFTGQQLRSAAFVEMLRIIREVEPPKPSTKLSSSAELPSIAAKRKLEPKKLTRLVQGELDWIVMKCLEKERQRRYETANGLGMDLLRYLADEPVAAGPPSAAYWLRKFVRRNKGRVLATTVIFLALVGGIIGTSVGMMQARRSAEAERLAKDVAEQRLKQVEKGNEILVSIFRNLDPKTEEKEGKSLYVLLAEHLDEAVRQLEGEAVGDPVTVARMQVTLGESLWELGHFDQAQVVLQKAYQTLEASLGADHLDTLWSMTELARVYQARGRYDDAELLFKQVLAANRQQLGSDDPHTLTCMANLAVLYHVRGRYDDAEPLFEQVLKANRHQLGPDHPDTRAAMHNLAALYQARGRYDDAEPLFEQVLKANRHQLGADHPHTLTCMAHLALLYKTRGRYDDAETLYKQVLEASRRKLGPDHPDTLTAVNNLAGLYRARGRYGDAEPLFEQALEASRHKLGLDHPSTLLSINNLAALYWTMKKLDRSIPLFEECLKFRRAKLGSDHPETLLTLANLGVNYRDASRLEEGIRCLEEAMATARKRPSPLPAVLVWIPGELAATYDRAEQFAKSEGLYREFLHQARQQFGTDDARTAGQAARLGLNLLQQKKYADAEPLLRQCLAVREKKEPDHWTTFNTKSMLGGALLGQNKYADAELLLLAGFEGMKRREAKMPPEAKDLRLREAVERLVQLYNAWGKEDEAKKWQTRQQAMKAADELKKP